MQLITKSINFRFTVLQFGTALSPLQKSESQHLNEHSPPASLQGFNTVLALSQRALVEQLLAKDFVSPTLGILNTMERVAQ